MMTREMAAFVLRSTGDEWEAARAAEQLGSLMVKEHPRVSFPGSWVLTQLHRSGEVVAYLVSHCSDSGALREIASVDRRVVVVKALDDNWAFEGRRSHLQRLSDQLSEIESHSYFRFHIDTDVRDLVMSAVSAAEGDLHGVVMEVNRALRLVAQRGRVEDVVQYMRAWYKLGPTTERAMWRHASLAPDEVFAMLTESQRAKAVLLFMRAIESNEEPRLGWEAATLFIASRCAAPMVGGTERKIFSEEAVDVLLPHLNWRAVLSRQALTPRQFSRLVELTEAKERPRLATMLHGERGRLRLLISRMDGVTVRVRPGEIALMAMCVDSGDVLLDWVVRHASTTELVDMTRRKWQGATKAIVPSARHAELLCARSIDSNVRKVISMEVYDGRDWGEWCEVLLDKIGGVAFEARSGQKAGAYIYKRLMGTGAGQDKALEQFFHAGEYTSLDNICSVLTGIGMR